MRVKVPVKFDPPDKACDLFEWRWFLQNVLRWKTQSAYSWNSGVILIKTEVGVSWLSVCLMCKGALQPETGCRVERWSSVPVFLVGWRFWCMFLSCCRTFLDFYSLCSQLGCILSMQWNQQRCSSIRFLDELSNRSRDIGCVFIKLAGVTETLGCQDLGERLLSECLYWRYRIFLIDPSVKNETMSNLMKMSCSLTKKMSSVQMKCLILFDICGAFKL